MRLKMGERDRCRFRVQDTRPNRVMRPCRRVSNHWWPIRTNYYNYLADKRVALCEEHYDLLMYSLHDQPYWRD